MPTFDYVAPTADEQPDTRTAPQFPIIETECSIEHEGHTFTAHGALFDLDRGGSLYATGMIPRSDIGKYRYDGRTGRLTTWSGERVGYYRIQSSWFRGANYGRYAMVSIAATIQGREYHGRYSPDNGQLVNLRPRKSRRA